MNDVAFDDECLTDITTVLKKFLTAKCPNYFITVCYYFYLINLDRATIRWV